MNSLAELTQQLSDILDTTPTEMVDVQARLSDLELISTQVDSEIKRLRILTKAKRAEMDDDFRRRLTRREDRYSQERVGYFEDFAETEPPILCMNYLLPGFRATIDPDQRAILEAWFGERMTKDIVIQEVALNDAGDEAVSFSFLCYYGHRRRTTFRVLCAKQLFAADRSAKAARETLAEDSDEFEIDVQLGSDRPSQKVKLNRKKKKEENEFNAHLKKREPKVNAEDRAKNLMSQFGI